MSDVANEDREQKPGACSASLLRPPGECRPFIQRYEPPWQPAPAVHESELGPVHTRSELLRAEGPEFSGRVTYALADDQWVQEFQARIVDDDELSAALRTVGLTTARQLDESGRWVEAIRADAGSLPHSLNGIEGDAEGAWTGAVLGRSK